MPTQRLPYKPGTPPLHPPQYVLDNVRAEIADEEAPVDHWLHANFGLRMYFHVSATYVSITTRCPII